MIRFDDYPYAQFKEAIGTVIGRMGLVFLAALVGAMLGGVSATRSLGGLLMGVFFLPLWSLFSIFYGAGLFVFPALLIYTIASVRFEWPLRLTSLCSLLMWWNIHTTIRCMVFDNPTAKQHLQLQADLKEIRNEILQKEGGRSLK